LAMTAFQRAIELAADTPDPDATARRPFGLGCTASLATGRVKCGIHRAHVAIQTGSVTLHGELHFRADRPTEERALLELHWHCLAVALDLDLAHDLDSVPVISRTDAVRHWQDLVLGREMAWCDTDHDGLLLFPGAFNPLHHGHRKMLEIAERRTGRRGAYEL